MSKGVRLRNGYYKVFPDQVHFIRARAHIGFFHRKRALTHKLDDAVPQADGEDLPSRPHTPGDERLPPLSETPSVRSVTTEKSPVRSGLPTTNQNSEFVLDPSRESLSPTAAANGIFPHHHRSSSTQTDTVNLREFHVLVWVAIRLGRTPLEERSQGNVEPTGPEIKVEKSISGKSDRELVHIYLKSLDEWLDKQKDTNASLLYRKCPPKSLRDVERALQGMVKSRLDSPEIEAEKIRLFHAAKSIFLLFLPLQQRSAMCFKIWGALHTAVTVSTRSNRAWSP
jgi:hypothetical protein